jgi:hypothetical protein
MQSERPVPPKTQRPAETPREERLKAALKANMARRKAQARARETTVGAEDKGAG